LQKSNRVTSVTKPQTPNSYNPASEPLFIEDKLVCKEDEIKYPENTGNQI
jgi:hypothetical protein